MATNRTALPVYEELLLDDHDDMRAPLAAAVRAACRVLEDPANPLAADDVQTAWSFVTDWALRHMREEEAIHFPQALSCGVPPVCIDALRVEHDALRRVALHLASEGMGDGSVPRRELMETLLRLLRAFQRHAEGEEAVIALFRATCRQAVQRLSELEDVDERPADYRSGTWKR